MKIIAAQYRKHHYRERKVISVNTASLTFRLINFTTKNQHKHYYQLVNHLSLTQLNCKNINH